MLDVGETVTEEPLPTAVPPQDDEYHCQLAPVPKEPPITLKVVEPPLQIVVLPEIAIGALDKELTFIVTCAQVVTLQVPSARTK